ncbi:NAD(P)-dependent oxidoreductase [Sphaerisporangium fuscum]|uniref:NAD(P)-dependent oxidoreductase n=1 Tax=Sphaerisporangium fuscum TaxID=2835868 RepID=UPI001BDC7171|nr:NAD(P)-dependent oxidoreductase [Sphaerisporangium fuscum]
MRTAVLGMGAMGRALAGRLLAHGHEVIVWNRTPGRAAELVEAGAAEASSPAQATREAEVALMSLADDRAVLDVVERLSGPGSAAVVADMSTVSPDTSRRLQDMIPGRRFVSAPIMGAPQAVLDGTASGLLGGDRALVDRLEPIWSTIFSAHWYCGEDPGGATAFKLLNNYLLMSGIAVVAEAVATAEAAGLDRNLLRELLFTLPTVPPGLRNRLDDILGGDHQGWFSTHLGAKDVRLFAEVAESNGLPLPIARLVQRRYQEAAGASWRDADIAAVVELVRAARTPRP